MTPLSIQVPFPVFQDRDGQPLDNGYVWIGQPNLNPQTNPVVAYFDAALTIPAAQPLRTLNGYVSNAGTPAQVYIDGNNFSILVQDSKGSMVYNFPQGTGIEPVPNNASGIVYDPAGVGAVPTTVQTKLRETVSFEDFGAVGDGVTNDTTAVANALASGGKVTGTNGKTYLITAISPTTDFVLDLQGATLMAVALSNCGITSSGRAYFTNGTFDNVWLGWTSGCDGGGVTKSKFVNQTYSNTTAISGASNVTVADNYFTGHATGPTGTATYPCFQVTTGAHDCTFERNYCYDVEAGVTNDGITIDTYNIIIRDNYFDTLTFYAAKNDVGYSASFINNHVSNTVYGIFQVACYNTVIEGNSFDSVTGGCLYSADTTTAANVQFNKNKITNSDTGVNRGLVSGTVNDNHMTGGTSLITNLVAGATNASMASFVMLNLEIARNTILSSVNNTAGINDTESVPIQGAIVVTGSNGSTFSYRGLVSIHGNRIVGYFGNAIMLPRNSTVQGNNVHIYDNTFYEGASSVKAINISSVGNLTIEGNNLITSGSGIGHFWNSSARVYGNVIIKDNAWQYVAAAPSTLIHVKGETYTNTTFTAGGYKDFLCITSGTPGTWKGFGSIAP